MVSIRAVGCDLNHPIVNLGADRSESSADIPGRVGVLAQDRFSVVRAGIGREVEVVTQSAHKGVANRSTNEIQIVTSLCEGLT